MIVRIWHGWTTPDNADRYEQLLREEIFPEIGSRSIDGLREMLLYRRAIGEREVEFVTSMRFDSWDAVRAFAGNDFQQAYVPDNARAVLKRFDALSRHYEVKERIEL